MLKQIIKIQLLIIFVLEYRMIVSSYNVGYIVQNILAITDRKIREREFINAHMNSYSCHRMIHLVNQLGDQLLTSPNDLQQMQQQMQPSKIGCDNFMPLNNFEQVAQSSSSRQQNNNTVTSQIKNVKKSSHHQIQKKNSGKNTGRVSEQQKKIQKQANKISQVKKLKYQQGIQDQQMVKIRKDKEKLIQEANQTKRHKAQSVAAQRRQKQVINFDYNGHIIQVKAQKRNNFISKLIVPKVPVEINQKKQSPKSKVTYLQTHQSKQANQNTKNKKQLKLTKQKQVKFTQQKIEVIFSRIKNPIQNLQINQGVKATFNQSVLQKRKKIDSHYDATKPNKKLSRDQYQKIKTTTLKTTPYQPEQPKTPIVQPLPITTKQQKQQTKKPRTITSSKRRSVTEADDYKVHIDNANLKKQLLQKQKQELTTQKQVAKKVLDDRPQTQIKKKQQLNNIDKYNLNYSRNKTQYSTTNKIYDQDHLLPKINLKVQSNIPKTRQKLKDGAAMRREAMKKFQQNLRI